MEERKTGKVALHNLGCKVNAYEVDAMREMLRSAGYEIVPFAPGADIYIVNTCTVTNIADRKSRQMLRRAKRMNPNALVVATGCYVQAKTNPETYEEGGTDEGICADVVIGNNHKKDLIGIIENHIKNASSDIRTGREYENLHISNTAGHTRAYVKVQDGCDRFCSYCIIPYVRGRARSRGMEDVRDEVSRLAANGYREIVLTGIHLSSYGTDLKGCGLLSLLGMLHDIDGICRIRLGSLEPGIITEDFAASISGMDKICPHFHLSLQSGCDRTLTRMNRRYTSGEYYEKCRILRKYFHNPALTTDIIVGFPGETDEDFEESREFTDKIGFYETHVFKYSMREGTKAASMPCQIPEQVKALRSDIMLELNEKKRAQYEQALYGTEKEVLIEEEIRHDGKIMQAGHTGEYVRVAVSSREKLKNRIVKVRIGTEAHIIH